MPPSSPSQPRVTTHRTGLPINAVDINKEGTHAVLAGPEILKIIRCRDGNITDELNIRSAVGAHNSTHPSPQLGSDVQRREYLPARDVRWSTGDYKHIIATAANNGRISLYDVNSPRIELRRFHEHANQINKLDFDPFAGYYLLSASQDKSVRLWDVRAGKPDRSHSRFEPRVPVRDVKWSPVELFDFAVCTDGGVVQLWDARSPLGPKLSINGHEKACYSIDWHPDGRHIVSGGFDRYIRVWDFQLDNKRQKPVFQFRAPCAIRNITWRPATKPSEGTESAYWQSTQIAATYHKDDPRIHVWDLRRPWLPFRELDRYNLPVNDILWANKDVLWTVGEDGLFTHWDLQRSTPFYNELPPSTSAFMPDGECYSFSEERSLRRGSSLDDPALGFLSVPKDKLSSGEDPPASRSLTDDEGTLDSAHRRQERSGISARSTKSQANSPPSVDDRPAVLALDKSVFQPHDMFHNNQVGAVSFVPGLVAESNVVAFLAANYASPSLVDERAQSPDQILERLSAAFHHNANACDAVSMHRMAQTWRVLETVIVPELKDWADTNRRRRRADAAKRRDTLESFRSGSNRSAPSPLAGLPIRGNPREGSKSQNLRSHLFKNKLEADFPTVPSESESTSNMTTPLAKPIPISSPSGRKRWSHFPADEDIDDLPPLPPSVLSSHTTAAAASRALVDSPGRGPRSESNSPEVIRTPQPKSTDNTDISPRQLMSPKQTITGQSDPQHSKNIPIDKRLLSPRVTNQEDRRAALRDYKIQTRPIFSLDESSSTPAVQPRNGSGDSFQMFSASTDSSQKARSLGQSFESPNSVGARSQLPKHGTSEFDDDEIEDSQMDLSFEDSQGSRDARRLHRSDGTSRNRNETVAASDTALELSFGTDGSFDARERSKSGFRKPALLTDPRSITSSELNTTLSSPHDIFEFEELSSVPKSRIHTTNPLHVTETLDKSGEGGSRPREVLAARIPMHELDHPTYLLQDFRPIDLFLYEPKSPFAWSSLPLVCQSIAFDVENGIGHAQFAVHLLMHLHPYFFHPSFRELKFVGPRQGESLADRLMIPHLGHRIIESILENHLTFLKQSGMVESAAMLRKVCVEFQYPRLYSVPDGDKPTAHVLTGGDAFSLSMVCHRCNAPLPQQQTMCDRCRTVRPACPVCLSVHGDDVVPGPIGTGTWQEGLLTANIWGFCHACGHSGHVGCLDEWFSQPSSHGTCPSPGCGCDCGPGLTRELRIQQQMKHEEEIRLIRGSSNDAGATRRDSLRAGVSPAVDKARASLRTSLLSDRGTQSGDERSIASRRGSSRGRMTGFNSSRKSVRLVTPGEESRQGEP